MVRNKYLITFEIAPLFVYSLYLGWVNKYLGSWSKIVYILTIYQSIKPYYFNLTEDKHILEVLAESYIKTQSYLEWTSEQFKLQVTYQSTKTELGFFKAA
jgi:hypothetical protein